MEVVTWSRKGWRGRGAFQKLLWPTGVQFSYVIFGGDKVLIYHTFLTPPPPPGRRESPGLYIFTTFSRGCQVFFARCRKNGTEVFHISEDVIKPLCLIGECCFLCCKWDIKEVVKELFPEYRSKSGSQEFFPTQITSNSHSDVRFIRFILRLALFKRKSKVL